MQKKNFIVLEGGLTKDPEVFDGPNVVHLSLAVDGAGSEKGVAYPTGYFDVKVWLNDSDYTPAATAKAVRQALQDKTLRKGARISIMGSLKQERWLNKDQTRSAKVVVVADIVEIYTPNKQNSASADNSGTQSATAAEPSFAPSF